ncbi:MAG TPA: GSCFA domain-containing protein [Bacteroidales bacterium]|nr:GSCFA domain-containing protein [Bacteroidales bacterium]
MKFTTEVPVSKPSFTISHTDLGLALGSCFTTYIGNRMHELKFPILVNPLGTIYNPASIAQSIDILVGTKQISQADLFLEQEVWQSFFLHSQLSNIDSSAVIEQVNQIQHEFAHNKSKLSYVILSLGTSWVYTHNSSGTLVSNCHKQPSSNFTRSRLSVPEIVAYLHAAIKQLREATHNELQIIFTLSPIRHTKDGAFGNNVSKAALLLAIDELLHIPNTWYFPAYEIVIDELRDYRYYAADMIHPSETAISYIFEKFSTGYFSRNTMEMCSLIESIQKAVKHRPFNAENADFQNFIKQQIKTIDAIRLQYPHLNFESERKLLEQKIT